jgi:hypothetical protein
MQFPVPQFTEVEDKIIGSLTIKQFGIIFAAGILIFLGYSASKSILVLVFLFVLFGIPALGLAFANINGRPLYNTIGFFIKFILSPKLMVFHKETNNLKSLKNLRDAELSSAKKDEAKPPAVHQASFEEVQELLRKTASEERDIAGRMRQ